MNLQSDADLILVAPQQRCSLVHTDATITFCCNSDIYLLDTAPFDITCDKLEWFHKCI